MAAHQSWQGPYSAMGHLRSSTDQAKIVCYQVESSRRKSAFGDRSETSGLLRGRGEAFQVRKQGPVLRDKQLGCRDLGSETRDQGAGIRTEGQEARGPSLYTLAPWMGPKLADG